MQLAAGRISLQFCIICSWGMMAELLDSKAKLAAT